MNETELLALWEQALLLAPPARERALARAAGAAPHATLGQYNHALLQLRERLFGRRLALRVACPRCAGELDFEADSAALGLSPCNVPAAAVRQIEHGGLRVHFRAPRVDDLEALAGDATANAGAEAFARALFERCVVEVEGSGDGTHALESAVDRAPTGRRAAALSREVQAAVALQLDALDPHTSLEFALHCPACGHHFDAPLDLAALLWSELRHRAEQILADVAALAHAYGWREGDVLGLTPTRRAAYLQLAQAL